jgi:hypothetical protein
MNKHAALIERKDAEVSALEPVERRVTAHAVDTNSCDGTCTTNLRTPGTSQTYASAMRT